MSFENVQARDGRRTVTRVMQGKGEKVCRGVGSVILAVALCVTTASCVPTRLMAVPIASEEAQASANGLDNFRYWGDASTPYMIQQGLDASLREAAARMAAGEKGPRPPANFLAISGGGENGAFGAGLLVGWTAAGNRPTFKLVTGVSTGALIAPYAFLGSQYDELLKKAYTTMTRRDVMTPRWITAALLNDAMADNAPLRQTVARLIDQPIIDAIASEYRKGRLLLISTTNLDASRPVIWDIGKLAASGDPKALELTRDLLVASAAIPGAFPPTMINVDIGEKHYQEMHVDGGASSQVFVYPPNLELSETRERNLYVIRNARLDSDWAQVNRTTLSISARAVSSLIQTQGIGDLYRIYLVAKRDRVDFNLAFIPPSFNVPLQEPFDTHYMNELFELGYNLAVKGYPWAKTPPGLSPSSAVRPTRD